MKHKIALCLFGGFASTKPKKNIKKVYDPFETFWSLNKNFLKEYNPDIFFHTWSTKYDKKILKLYKPKKYKVENQKKFNVKIKDYSLNYLEFYDNIKDILNRNMDPKVEYNNLIFRTHSRWYSQCISLKLMNDYSILKKIKYDLVVQSRFDLIYNEKISLDKISKNKLHLVDAQHLQNKKQLYDIFFVSNQKISLLFSDIFKNLRKYPIDSTNILPIFLKEYKIKHKNTFKFKNVILKRHYRQYFNLNAFNFIQLKIKGRIYKILKKLIKTLNKILTFIE